MGRFRVALQAGALVCVMFLASLLTYNQPVTADELQNIEQLYKMGESPKALERLEIYLSAKPLDGQGTKTAQAMFLKGLILAHQGKTAEAIAVYVSLTENYPELPESYNNLAVLYASQGRMDKAQQALEMAINAHPCYATAYENLGDVYIQMARRSYDKAAQLDKGNATALTKLTQVKELSANTSKSAPTAVNSKAGI